MNVAFMTSHKYALTGHSVEPRFRVNRDGASGKRTLRSLAGHFILTKRKPSVVYLPNLENLTPKIQYQGAIDEV